MYDTLTHSYTSSPLLKLTCAKGSSVAQEVMDTHIHTKTHRNTRTGTQDTDTQDFSEEKSNLQSADLQFLDGFAAAEGNTTGR